MSIFKDPTINAMVDAVDNPKKSPTFDIGLEPEYSPEDYPINIRFVCQGMVKVPQEAVPPDLKARTRQEIMEWARNYWQILSREDLLVAVAYLDIEEDASPGAVEENDGDDYEILAETQEWFQFNQPFPTNLQKVLYGNTTLEA
jgi:hypothetical protein